MGAREVLWRDASGDAHYPAILVLDQQRKLVRGICQKTAAMQKEDRGNMGPMKILKK